MTRRAPIPLVRATGNSEVDRAMEVIRLNLDGIAGHAKDSAPLKPLASSATLGQVITQLNALLKRIEG